GDGGGYAAAGGAAQQERGEQDGPAGGSALAAGHREREVDEELSRAGVGEDRAVDGEEDDEGGRDVEGGAEDALQRHVELPHQSLHVVSAVRERRGDPRAGEGVDDEGRHHPGQDQPRGAAYPLQDEQDEDHAKDEVEPGGLDRPLDELVEVGQEISDGGDAEQRQHHVVPADAVPLRAHGGEEQVEEEEHEPEVGGAQDVGGDDRVGGVQVVERHGDRHHRHQDLGLAGEAADCALLLLHQLLGLPLGLLAHDDVLQDGGLAGGRGHD